MSDDLTISSGGVIAVDTAELDAAALRLDHIAELLAVAVTETEAGARRAGGSDLLLYGRTMAAAEAVRGVVATARDLAEALRVCAATYAIVELHLAREAARAAGDETAAARAQAGIDELAAARPSAAAAAQTVWDGAPGLGGEAAAQLAWGGLLASPGGFGLLSLFAAGLVGVRALGIGTVDARTPVLPGGTAATLTPAFASQRAVAPQTLADAAARIPASGPSRVRVEQYAHPDGARSFAVYVAGTRAVAGRDPWDMASNLASMTGRRSDALASVEAALQRAGARPGDRLYAFGHSQGGMIAGQMEQAGVYDVRVVGTFGSPTAVDVGDATLSAQVRHADDPVPGLAVGHGHRVGAEGGFVAERVVDPRIGTHDLTLPAHHLETYVETAALVDASGDPRVHVLHERLAELGEAELVEVREYAAERSRPGRSVSPGSSGAG